MHIVIKVSINIWFREPYFFFEKIKIVLNPMKVTDFNIKIQNSFNSIVKTIK